MTASQLVGMVLEPITRTIPRQFRTVTGLFVHPLVRIDAIDPKALKRAGTKESSLRP